MVLKRQPGAKSGASALLEVEAFERKGVDAHEENAEAHQHGGGWPDEAPPAAIMCRLQA